MTKQTNEQTIQGKCSIEYKLIAQKFSLIAKSTDVCAEKIQQIIGSKTMVQKMSGRTEVKIRQYF